MQPVARVVWNSEVKWFSDNIREWHGMGFLSKLTVADLGLVWRCACGTLGLPNYETYQIRPKDPSLDQVEQLRLLQIIQKRGRRKQFRSAMRYENAVALAADRPGVMSGRVSPPALSAQSHQ